MLFQLINTHKLANLVWNNNLRRCTSKDNFLVLRYWKFSPRRHFKKKLMEIQESLIFHKKILRYEARHHLDRRNFVVFYWTRYICWMSCNFAIETRRSSPKSRTFFVSSFGRQKLLSTALLGAKNVEGQTKWRAWVRQQQADDLVLCKLDNETFN